LSRLASSKVFIEECVAEMQKVTWPEQEQLKNATWVVILFTILIAAIIWIMDIVSRLLIVDGIMGIFGA